MAYSIIEQQTRDIDIFVKDNNKKIHITSAGGRLPDILAENDIRNELIISQRNNFVENFDFIVNPNLNDILNFATENDLENYLTDFTFMAKCGFYSYDKSNLGNFEDQTYHLVAWPGKRINNNTNSLIYEQLISIDRILPTELSPFNLFEYLR
nr:hypothetical protein [uncultured Flavobacterium sp.]